MRYNHLEKIAGRVVVVNQQVDGVLGKLGESSLSSQLQNLILDLLGGSLTFSKREQVCSKTSDVRTENLKKEGIQ
jgi:hypothetical protein